MKLIDVICEYRLTYMKLVVEHLHPDCIVSHDDWGKDSPVYVAGGMEREFFKEPLQKTL